MNTQLENLHNRLDSVKQKVIKIVNCIWCHAKYKITEPKCPHCGWPNNR